MAASLATVDSVAETEDAVPDNGSSSLSDLDVDEVSDDDNDSVHQRRANSKIPADTEADSEAETERLEKTPRKPTLSDIQQSMFDKSPSKLSTVITQDGLDADLDDLDSVQDDPLQQALADQDQTTDDSLPLVSSESKGSLGKRKRLSQTASSLSDVASEEPSPKRSHGLAEAVPLDTARLDRALQEEAAESTLEAQDMNGDADELPVEANEGGTSLSQKGRFGRKSRRKGRREIIVEAAETPTEAPDTPVPEAEEQIDDEAEEEEEEDNSHDEERKHFLLSSSIIYRGAIC
jgi:hypothetical protein